jgi:hypothetical protein
MITEPNVLSLNLNSVILSPFQLNIPHLENHLLKGSLNSHVRGTIKVLIKLLNLLIPINLSF